MQEGSRSCCHGPKTPRTHSVAKSLHKLRECIPYKPHQIPKQEVAMQWDHLNRIAKELMPYREDVQVGMLIGTNCTKAIKLREVIPGGDNDSYGIKTDLG